MLLRFECDECTMKFTQKSHLIVHRALRTGARNVHCNECGKKFITKSVLRKHSLIHTKTSLEGKPGRNLHVTPSRTTLQFLENSDGGGDGVDDSDDVLNVVKNVLINPASVFAKHFLHD